MNRFTRVAFVIALFFWVIEIIDRNLASAETPNDFRVLYREINESVPRFYGLAAYYNNVSSCVATASTLSFVEQGREIVLQKGEYFVSLGRKRAFVIVGESTLIDFGDDSISVRSTVTQGAKTLSYYADRSELGSINPELARLRYSSLWKPLAAIAWSIEWILATIQIFLGIDWGLAILALALVLKILLLPISMLTLISQRNVAKFQSLLEPKISKIKAEFRGEEAHIRIMDAHKELGVSPLFTLKPLLSTLIQIPVLIAVFNVLGEMPNLMGSSFLWIKDLSYPDSVAQLPFVIPLLGSSFNLLPVLMTIITIVSTILFRNRHAPDGEVRRQKRKLYFMAFAFLILFYPFPASMVLYWTAANALQLLQQRIFD